MSQEAEVRVMFSTVCERVESLETEPQPHVTDCILGHPTRGTSIYCNNSQ